MNRRGAWSRVLASGVVATAVVAVVGASTTTGASAAPPDPATTCRAANPAGTAILSTVEPVIKRYLGTHPKSTTPGMSVGFVTPTPLSPSVPALAIINCGVTAKGGSTPVTSDTTWEIGSQSKAFTATSLAQLVNRGTVTLNQSLQSLLPSNVSVPTAPCDSSPGPSITLQQLATHNAGLQKNPNNVTWGDAAPEGHKIYTRSKMYGSFASSVPPCRALLSLPGTKWSYSNWGFALLGMVLADKYAPTTGVPNYGKMVSDLVTGPLGLTHTVLEPLDTPTNLAAPTCTTPPKSGPCYWDNVNAFAGGGGLVSNVGDMARFTAAQIGLVPAGSVSSAITLTHQPFGYGPDCATSPTCQGLAWQITPPGASGSVTPFPVYDKDGGTWGMHSHTFFATQGCWGLTLLSNSNESFPVGVGGVAGPIMSALGKRNYCPGIFASGS